MSKFSLKKEPKFEPHKHVWEEIPLETIYKSGATKVRHCRSDKCPDRELLVGDQWHPISLQSYELMMIRESNAQQGKITCPKCNSTNTQAIANLPTIYVCQCKEVFHKDDAVRPKKPANASEVVTQLLETLDRLKYLEKLAVKQLAPEDIASPQAQVIPSPV